MSVAARWTRFVIVATYAAVTAVSIQQGLTTASAVGVSCPGGAVLNVVAHPDDDLLFLSSDLLHSIATPGVCVRTLYVTAGDAGGVLYYARSREAGDRAAYAEMAGVANSWTLSDAGIAGHPITRWTLDGNPAISLEFLRLPDGNEDGSGWSLYNFQSLQKLYQGIIPSIQAIDASSSYSKSDLTNTILTVMNEFGATEVRTMDYVGTYGTPGNADHSDHYSTAYFARAASLQYPPSHLLTGYEGYGTDPKPANLSAADTAAKEAAWFAYAPYDDAVCQTEAACFDTAPQKWWARQYTVGSEIDGGNHPPVANAGPDQTVHPGLVVTLDGSASNDPDGDAVTYKWTQTSGTAVTLSNATAVKPTFTAPSTLGALGFSLTVKDTSAATGSDAVTITIGNRPPTANAGPDQTVHPGVVVTLNGSASSDPDGDTLTYAWTQTSGTSVTLSDPTATKPTFTAPNTLGTIGLSLTVTDTFGATSTDGVTITMGNRPPVANAGPDQTIHPGVVVTLNGSASSDPDGDTLTYAWTQTSGTSVTLSDPTATKPTFTAPNTLGTIGLSLTVTDTFGSKASDGVTITVANRAPKANAGPDQTVRPGGFVTLDGSASSDPDADTLTYLWKQTSGTAVTLSDPTAIKPTFTAPTKLGGIGFSLTVTDPFGAKASDGVNINVVNHPPKANAGPDQTVLAGVTVTLNGSASSDPDGDTLTYAWKQTAGTLVTLANGSTATPTFTAPSVATKLTFSLTVTDQYGATNSQTVNVTVKLPK